MIKVYLDWNCITHCKDLWPEFKELLERYSNVFICPFGVAHLRDVQTNHEAYPEEYEKDLDLLTEISQRNMLHLQDGRLSLYKVTPREYLANPTIDFNLTQTLNNIIPYYAWRKRIRENIEPKVIRRISIENDPAQVIPKINNLINEDIDSLFKRYNFSGENHLEIKLRNLYYMLDIMGYKSEKKPLSNVDTDALHIITASICDYLISGDGKFCDKARAIYSQTHCVTKVMDPHTFIQEMPSIVKKCYDIEHIPEIMQTYGFPKIQEDGAHLKALAYPLWGCFKYCYNTSALDNSRPKNEAVFLPERQFMFFDELWPIAHLTSQVLPENERNSYIKGYINSFIQKSPIEKFAFYIDSSNYRFDCVLMTFDGLPALKVSYYSKTI